MNTQTGIVSSTKTTKTKPIRIADWIYWQWRYEQALAKEQAIFHATSKFGTADKAQGKGA
jgi:hypothetical protein